jgi:hypothetical protein
MPMQIAPHNHRSVLSQSRGELMSRHARSNFSARPYQEGDRRNTFAVITGSADAASNNITSAEADYSAKCSYKMIPGSSADTFQEYSFA